jgi:hypothetical protein
MIDQELVDTLAEHFRKGATVKIAAGLIGVPPGVLRMWLIEGERQLADIYAADVGYPEHEGLLYLECAKATAEYLAERVGVVTDPQESDWRSSSWLLERRDEDFNLAAKVDITSHSTVEVVQHDRDVIAAELLALGFVVPVSPGETPALLPARTDAEAADGAHPAEAVVAGEAG